MGPIMWLVGKHRGAGLTLSDLAFFFAIALAMLGVMALLVWLAAAGKVV